MRFVITMNMPANSGNLIHQVMCEYPANSIEDFCKALEQNDFLIVDELYKNSKNVGYGMDPYYCVGKTAINHLHVGKIKELGIVTTANKVSNYD
jgi:hypothetical protein